MLAEVTCGNVVFWVTLTREVGVRDIRERSVVVAGLSLMCTWIGPEGSRKIRTMRE